MSKPTITRWVKEILNLPEIDTNVYQTHSVRSASSSKANLKGVTTNEILQMGNWKNKSTWEMFYHKKVVSTSEQFQNKVLQKQTPL